MIQSHSDVSILEIAIDEPDFAIANHSSADFGHRVDRFDLVVVGIGNIEEVIKRIPGDGQRVLE